MQKRVQVSPELWTQMIIQGWDSGAGVRCVEGLPEGAKLVAVQSSFSGILEFIYDSDQWPEGSSEDIEVILQRDYEIEEKVAWLRGFVQHTLCLGRHWKRRARALEAQLQDLTGEVDELINQAENGAWVEHLAEYIEADGLALEIALLELIRVRNRVTENKKEPSHA